MNDACLLLFFARSIFTGSRFEYHSTGQMMHIMAAVDVDMRRVKKAGKVRSSEAGESLQIHEKLLCSIKAHQHGTLEMAPGESAAAVACYVMRLGLSVAPQYSL